MKRYELKYKKGEEGVFCMSLVENPATRTQLVMFSDEKKLLEFQDDEKQVIYSVAMRPNMLIPRKDIEGDAAMVFYTEETVKDLQQNFFKNNSHNGSTINHNGKKDNSLYIFESWIVENPEKDKATELGLQVQKGDWVTAQKIDSPEVWQDVKSGKLTGFSIEAFLEPVLINNKTEMTKEEVDARIKKIMMESEEEKAKAEAEAKLAEEEKLKKEQEMEGETMPPAETPEDPAAKIAELQKVIDDKDVEINELKAKITQLESGTTEMSAQLVATKKVALEMAEEMKKGITPKGGGTDKKYEEMSNVEKAKFNRGKL
jgi:hypothetical protein